MSEDMSQLQLTFKLQQLSHTTHHIKY